MLSSALVSGRWFLNANTQPPPEHLKTKFMRKIGNEKAHASSEDPQFGRGDGHVHSRSPPNTWRKNGHKMWSASDANRNTWGAAFHDPQSSKTAPYPLFMPVALVFNLNVTSRKTSSGSIANGKRVAGSVLQQPLPLLLCPWLSHRKSVGLGSACFLTNFVDVS